MNSRKAGDLLLKAQTVTSLYFDTKEEHYNFWIFEKQLQGLWWFTDDEIYIIWGIFHSLED